MSHDECAIPGPSGSGDRIPLTVKLQFNKNKLKSTEIKKIRARALARAHKSAKVLESQIVNLKRKLKARSKQVEILNSTEGSECTTHQRRTNLEIEALRLAPKRKKFVKRKLLMNNIVMTELKETKKACTLKKDPFTLDNFW